MKLWQWLSGRKQKIANAYWGLWLPITLIPGIDLHPKVVLGSTIFGLCLTYLGAGHAAIKAHAANKENANA